MTIATMKKFMKSLMLVAVAAMGLTACQNDINEQVNATKGEVTVTFIANSADATRTSVSIDADKNVTFAWDEEESFVVLESIDGAAPTQALSVDFENVDGLAEISATFEENFDGVEYNYVAVYPTTNWVAETYTDLKKHKLIFKTQQTMAEGSYDPTADLMISKLLTLDIQPSNEAFEMEFQRLVAVGKMAVKNLPVVGEEKILSVEFTTGKTNLSGRAYVDLAEGKVTEHGYSGNGVKSVKVSCELAAAATNDIFFTCMPATLAEGETYTIIVTTDKASYTKTGTIGAKALEFKAGDVTGFTANMEGVTRNVIEKLEGNYIIVAKRGTSGNFFYMTPALGTASTKRFQAVDTGCAALEEIDVEMEDYTWTIAKSGDYYTISEPNGQFINWTSGNSTALTDAARELTITKVKDKEYYNIALQDTPARVLSLNSTAGNNYFCFYGTLSQSYNLYLLPAIVDPRDKQELSFSYTSTTYILDSEEEEFEEPKLVGAQTAVTYASSDEEIATVDANGNVTFEGATGTVTITATATEDDDYREGKASYTINVESAVIEELTIAEFIAKEASTNTYYQLTGRVIRIDNTTHGNFTIKDANNQLDVRGLTKTKQTTANDKSFSSLDIKVGDQVTFCAIRGEFNGTAQAGSNNQPAYYVAHEVDDTPEFLSLSTDNITFTAAGGNQTVTANVLGVDELTFSEDADWLTVAINGHVATITAAENTLTEELTATVTLTFGGVSKTVAVKQNAKVVGEAQEANITVEFKTTGMSKKVSSYTDTWDQTWNGTTLTVKNFNNNNMGWNYIKCGRKYDPSTASIATKDPITDKVSKVTVTVDNVLDASKVTSTKLYIATDSAFTSVVETISATMNKGELTFIPTNPGTEYYYKLEIVNVEHGSKNGNVQISKIHFGE